MSADKAAAMALSLATALAPTAYADLVGPLTVQLPVVLGAVAGTYAAIGYDETPRPRGRLFSLAVSTTILACALTGVVPAAFGWSWSSGGVAIGLAALAAFACYYLLPPAIKRAGELIRAFTWSDVLPWRKAAAAAAAVPAAPAAPPEGSPDP